MASDEDLIKAALIEDEEDKRQAAEDAKKTPPSDPSPDKNDKEDTTTDEDSKSKSDDTSDDEDNEEKADAKKAEDDQETDEQKADKQTAEDQKPQNRKEKREARKKAHQDFLASIKRDNAPSQQPLQRQPYDPLDYDKVDNPDVKTLAEDRTKYGEDRFSEGAQIERYVANQERFWDNMTLEARILETDPKYAFLNENNPTTFDPDKAEAVNEMYLGLVGYKETPIFDAKTGRPVINQATGEQLIQRTVDRTDLSYEKFVKQYVENVEGWVNNEIETTNQNLNEQRVNTGIRPGGNARKGLGKIKPGDISKMSQEEFEKHEDEIDRQILAELQ